MRKRTVQLVILVVLCTAIAWFALALAGAAKRKLADQRMADVQVLTRIYREQWEKGLGTTSLPPIDSTEQLLRLVEASGIHLHSPIPQNPAQPCYRLVYTPNNTNSRILIEETNITDQRTIVRSTIDGAVFMQGRTNSN